MLGEDLSLLKVHELVQLEQQIDLGVSRVRARKASIQSFTELLTATTNVQGQNSPVSLEPVCPEDVFRYLNCLLLCGCGNGFGSKL
jgi:hypothetical protein